MTYKFSVNCRARSTVEGKASVLNTGEGVDSFAHGPMYDYQVEGVLRVNIDKVQQDANKYLLAVKFTCLVCSFLIPLKNLTFHDRC